MQKINNIILNVAAILMAAMVSVGCLEKEDITGDVQSVMIELSVSSKGMTKSAPTASEKVINSLYVYAFYGERLAGYASQGAVAQGDPFYMDLELPETGIHNVEFYVIANAEQMAYENGIFIKEYDQGSARGCKIHRSYFWRRSSYVLQAGRRNRC